MRFIIGRQLIRHGQLFIIGSMSCLSCLVSSCNKEESEPGEWDNWQQRNEAYFASLQDSLQQNPQQWRRIKSFTLDPATEGQPTDYVFAKVIAEGTGTESPAYTDSVRVIYRGRFIPSATYPEGYVFEETVKGTFSPATGSTYLSTVSSNIVGYATALQHMHRGDHWRVYIPSELAYGDEGNTSVPGHSLLIYDMILVDFSHAGVPMPAWSSRQRR